MRTFRKTLLALGLAAVVALGVVWGSRTSTTPQPATAEVQNIQKPGHLAFADPINIQKPGH
jgi:hypothetical protein